MEDQVFKKHMDEDAAFQKSQSTFNEFLKDSQKDTSQRLETLEFRLFDEREGFLPRIEQQTIRTNGKVAEINQWRWIMIGGISVLTAIVIPVGVALIRIYL